MGQMAFLYRILKVHEISILDADRLDVWQVAVLLDVDTKWGPEGATIERQDVDDDLMNSPMEVVEMSLEQLQLMNHLSVIDG